MKHQRSFPLPPSLSLPSPRWKQIKYAQINKNENSKRSAKSRKENAAQKNQIYIYKKNKSLTVDTLWGGT